MAFVLKQSATYTWPVTLILPVNGGRREKHTFDAEFRRLPQTRINELRRMGQAMANGPVPEDEELIDQDAAREVMAGWSGVVDDEGNEIPFSESKLNELLEIPTIANQIFKAWFDSIEVAKKKN